jgi:protein gp37
MVFVNSMSDLFHEGIADIYVRSVAEVMAAAPWHTFQVLTKRAKRLRKLLSTDFSWAAKLRHVWWGVSVEDRKYGLPRIAELTASPATVRFLSIEPLLEDLGSIDLKGIHWVIVGGESGRGARPIKREWVVSILDQCRAAGIPFFFKQWGGVQKKRAGRLLDGTRYDEFPEIGRTPFPTRVQREKLLEDLKERFVRWGVEIGQSASEKMRVS